jgi:hypothetical protein
MTDDPRVAAMAVIVGITLIVTGFAFWFWPAALVVAGAVLVAGFWPR